MNKTPRWWIFCMVLIIAWIIPIPQWANAGAEQIVAFGPEAFEREKGAPCVKEWIFSLPEQVTAPFTLLIENGDSNGQSCVSSAEIYLNGTMVVAPSELSQNIRRIEKTVSLAQNNRIEVKLTSSPGSFLTISILAYTKPEQFLGEANIPIGEGDTTVEMGSISVSAPAGTLSGGDLTLITLDSPLFDWWAQKQMDNFAFVPQIPRIRIKTAVRPVNSLNIRIDTTNADIPHDAVPFFLGLVRTMNDTGEYEDIIIPIGGHFCSSNSWCVSILPEWMSQVNPLDPLDPVITIGLAYPIFPLSSAQPVPWSVTNLTPTVPVTVKSSQPVTVSAEFRVQSPFSFLPGSPVSPRIYSSRFYRQSGVLHGAVDLAVNNAPVYSVLPGIVTRSEFVPYRGPQPDPGFDCGGGRFVYGSYGNLIQVNHGTDFITRYAHLNRREISVQASTTAGVPIAVSGNTGRSCGPHLHFETEFIWHGQRFIVDPEPLLEQNPSLFLADTPPTGTAAMLILRLNGTDLATKRVKQSPYTFTESISLGQMKPGNYELELWLRAGRLGGDHQLAVWPITIAQDNPVIDSPAILPEGNVRRFYQYQLLASAGSPPYIGWNVVNGSLPLGLSLDNTGMISGTPGQSGAFTFEVSVTDSNGGSSSKAFSLTVSTPPPRHCDKTIFLGTYKFPTSPCPGQGSVTVPIWARIIQDEVTFDTGIAYGYTEVNLFWENSSGILSGFLSPHNSFSPPPAQTGRCYSAGGGCYGNGLSCYAYAYWEEILPNFTALFGFYQYGPAQQAVINSCFP